MLKKSTFVNVIYGYERHFLTARRRTKEGWDIRNHPAAKKSFLNRQNKEQSE